MHIYNFFMDSGIVSLYGTLPLQLKVISNLERVNTFLEVLMGIIIRNLRKIDIII